MIGASLSPGWQGVLVPSFVFWLFFLLPVVIHFVKKGERAEIGDEGISIYQKGKVVQLVWGEIVKIGFQVVMAKRMGVYEAFPYLSIKLAAPSLSKIDILKSSKEFGFIQKFSDLTGYMGQDKLDFYIGMQYAKENDSQQLIHLLSSRSVYIKSLSPLIKTDDKLEYERVVKENFKSGKF